MPNGKPRADDPCYGIRDYNKPAAPALNTFQICVQFIFPVSQIVNDGNVRLTGMELIHEGVLLSCEHPPFLYPADGGYTCSGEKTLGWDNIEAGGLNTTAT